MMTDQLIVYTRPDDGGVSIVVPVAGVTIEEILAKNVPATALNVRVITPDKLPTDRILRDAWTDANPTDTVDINMDKARALWKNYWRSVRKPLLEALDSESVRAQEVGDRQKLLEIITKKQTLRDVTQIDLSTASTPEELKAVWPETILGNNPFKEVLSGQ